MESQNASTPPLFPLYISPPRIAASVTNMIKIGIDKHPNVTEITLLRILPVAHPSKAAIIAIRPKISEAMKI